MVLDFPCAQDCQGVRVCLLHVCVFVSKWDLFWLSRSILYVLAFCGCTCWTFVFVLAEFAVRHAWWGRAVVARDREQPCLGRQLGAGGWAGLAHHSVGSWPRGHALRRLWGRLLDWPSQTPLQVGACFSVCCIRVWWGSVRVRLAVASVLDCVSWLSSTNVLGGLNKFDRGQCQTLLDSMLVELWLSILVSLPLPWV